ncbi:MAG: sulfatase-like hydrolase/transferase [Akkermansiaceae bacterium]
MTLPASVILCAAALTGFINDAHAKVPATKPNILIFYLDDMSWAQPGAYGGKLVPTPAMDAIARNGVRFTDGYVSACVCGPSRVALLTGRYQARSGHDANGGGEGREMVLSETTIAQKMKSAGYTTGIVGKWHLGASSPDLLPGARGFDYAIGSVGNVDGVDQGRFFRGNELIYDLPGEPITSPVYRDEAVKFITANRAQPWLLYMSFNAVHTPHVASPHWLEKFKDLPQRTRNYAANIAEADEAIGAVMAKLRDLRLEEDTLVFVISDNGGMSWTDMGGLRGRKWYLWEGGVRVPWMAQWKGRIPAGVVSNEPVIQIDVLPTALAAAGVVMKPEWQIDGVNLLPLLEGKTQRLAPRELYFRFGTQYAVRQGDWKLVKASAAMQPMLVNLAKDPGEKTDLTAKEPARVAALQALYDRWNATMQPPRWKDRRWDGHKELQAAERANRERQNKAK